MKQIKNIQWTLRFAVAGEFFGYGILSIAGNPQWIEIIQKITGGDTFISSQILFVFGMMDMVIAFILLLKPLRIIALWAAIWALCAGIAQLLVHLSLWEFLGSFATWGAPLALFLARGPAATPREWWR